MTGNWEKSDTRFNSEIMTPPSDLPTIKAPCVDAGGQGESDGVETDDRNT